MKTKVKLVAVVLTSLLLVSGILLCTKSPTAHAADSSRPPYGPPAPEGRRDQWLLLTLSPADGAPEEQMSRQMVSLFPILAEEKQESGLEGFAPFPNLGAVRLESPTRTTISRLASWPGVRSVVPASDQAAEIGARRVDAVRQAAKQAALLPADDEFPSQGPDPGTDARGSGILDSQGQSAGVNGLRYCQIYENENLVSGGVITDHLPMTVTLTSAGQVKSQVTTVADEYGDFRVHFTATIRGGDVVEVALPGASPIAIDVVPLSVEPDKASDVIRGTAPANEWVGVSIYSSDLG